MDTQHTTVSLTLAQARRAIARAEAEAAARGLSVSVAVLDCGGHPVALARMDGARFASADVAVGKAFAAAAFGVPSGLLGERTQPGSPAYGIQFANAGRAVPVRGGLPVAAAGRVVGAVGVSGGSPDEDEAIARAAVEAVVEPA